MSFLDKLSENFSRLLDEGDGCDVRIIIGEGPEKRTFNAHAIILKARSYYFQVALSRIWARHENGGQIVFTKPNITPVVFDIILRYIYAGTISYEEIDPENILNLIVAADELCLEELLDPIQDYLYFHKSEWLKQNMVSLYELVAKHTKLSILHKYCDDIITNDPGVFFNSNDFPLASEALLIYLVSQKDLVMKEIEIWEHLLRWGIAQDPTPKPSDVNDWTDADFTSLRCTLKNCIKYIRFCAIMPIDLEEKVKPFEKIIPPELLNTNHGAIARRWVDSKIIDYGHVHLISSWMDGRTSLNTNESAKAPYRFKLLIRGTRDGFSPKTFRELCNHQGATVVVAKIKGSNEIVGGYNPIEWGYAENGWINTPDSFIFTLGDGKDREKAYHTHPRKSTRAIYDRFNCGPRFGSDDFGMSLGGANFNEEGSCGCRIDYYRSPISDRVRFAVEEYEVFQITLQN